MKTHGSKGLLRFTGIAGRLTLGAAVFGALLSSVCGILGFGEFSKILKKQYKDSAYGIACTARGLLDPDRLDVYLETGNTDAEYEKTLAALNILAKSTNANFIYIVKVGINSGGTLDYTYIYETEPSVPGLKAYGLGYTERELKKDYFDGVVNIMENGGEKMEYYSDTVQTGYHVTVGIPVRNSSGAIAAMVCAEKPMSRLREAGAAYAGVVFPGTAAALAVFSAVYVLFLRRSVIKPVLAAARETKRFACEGAASEELLLAEGQLLANRRDEIGELARAVCKMEADIETYMADLASAAAERERVNTELEVAARIQASMLPSSFSDFSDRGDVDVCALMCPAKEVGGDFYDFFMADGTHAAVVAADVSGKGVPAALFMAIGKTLIRDRTLSGKSLDKVFEDVNRLLCGFNSEGLFITAFEGVLDLESGEFIFVNAGHETPYICRMGGVFEPHAVTAGFVLAGMENTCYKCGSIRLEEGDMLFQYTDGVTEATNTGGELYGDERLARALRENTGLSPAELLPKIKEDVDKFVGEVPQFDDITMICLEYKGKSRNIGYGNSAQKMYKK